ncbi:MAG: efflux RND transporter periplasmic adaptor subunit [Leptospirales bacterium]|nr:efflux RND transporter periplasmic adaptor subunit [Leptospirales bacterium]
MPKITPKRLIAAAALVTILFIFYAAKSCGSGIKYEYSYEKVSPGKVEKTVVAVGLLDLYNKHAVLCRISGVLNSVRVSPEDVVKKGQVLATIDSTEIDQSLMKVNTRLESSRLAMDLAQRRYNSKKELFKEKLISARDLEQGEIEYKTAVNDHKLLQLEQAEIRRQKTYSTIVSPIDGVVAQSFIGDAENKSNLAVQVNTLAFYIAPSLKTMELTLDIDESDIGNIKRNQKVVFTISAFPDKKFSGDIVSVSINPVNKGNLVVYQPVVICDNSEMLLKPGMTATATISIAVKEDVLRVPNQALIVSPDFFSDEPRNNETPVVWKKNNNPLQNSPLVRVEVKTGLTGDMFTEITDDSLQKGDEILVRIRQIEN